MRFDEEVLLLLLQLISCVIIYHLVSSYFAVIHQGLEVLRNEVEIVEVGAVTILL